MDYCISLKEFNIVEIIRSSVLWNLWLDRNRIIFKGRQIQDVHVLGAKILVVARFWALNKKSDLTSQLNLFFLYDLKDLIEYTLVLFHSGYTGFNPYA